MNTSLGLGVGLIVGACAGKVFRRQIMREVDALQRDIAWENAWNDDDLSSFRDWVNAYNTHLETYPSVFRRVQDRYYGVLRFIDRVKYFPDTVRTFIQRGRHGWSERDTWNLDTYLVDMLIPLLENYKENNISHPIDQTPEEHDDKIDQIIHGLRQYQLYMDNWHSLGIEDAQEAVDAAMKSLADAFTLLGEELPGLWI